ncbi:MAG: hypothetical protein SPI72_03410 [Porphyromonas sp.]|nr:hypothetical protein [Porphyromonas sp.]
MSTVIERINQIAETEGVSIFEIERKIGASRGTLYKALQKNTDIQAKWLSKVVENYPLYSTSWLLTGRGDMIKEEHKSSISQSITGDNNTMSGHDTLIQGEDNLISLYKKLIEEKEEQIRIKDEQIKKLLEIISSR